MIMKKKYLENIKGKGEIDRYNSLERHINPILLINYFRCLSEKAKEKVKEVNSQPEVIPCLQSEADVVAGVMSNVLR